MRNRYDLAAIARARGIRRRSIRFRPIITPRSFELAAAKLCAPAVREWRECIDQIVLPAYERALSSIRRDAATVTMDATTEVKAALDASQQRLTKIIASINPALRSWSVRVEAWQRQKFQAGMVAAVGADAFPYLSYADVAPEVDAALSRFSSLITKVSDQTRGRVEETVWRELLNQTGRDAIGAMLSEDLGIERRRTNLIAKDQTLKMASKLNQLRQQQAGIYKYIWVTAGDDRVRESHAANDGQIFAWNDPPANTGNPGEDINCRCTAQAYVDLMSEGDDDADN